MGVLRFRIASSDRVSTDLLSEIYTIDPMLIPAGADAELNNGQLVVDRPDGTSCRVYVPWRSDHFGAVYITTSTLPASERVYDLELELARGSVCRFTSQYSVWKEGGLQTSELLEELKDSAINYLNDAIYSEGTDSAKAAIRSIETVLLGINQLVDEFTRQMIDIRMEADKKLPTFFATIIKAGTEDFLPIYTFDAFNAVFIGQPERIKKGKNDTIDLCPVEDWHGTFDWVMEKRIRPYLGPFADWKEDALRTSNEDYQFLRDRIVSDTKIVGENLGLQTRLAFVAAGLSTEHHLYSDREILQLTIESISEIRNSNPDIAVFVSFDNPFGESALTNKDALSPIHAIDAMVRAEIGLAGIGLELTFGEEGAGLINRDLVQINDIMDNYAQFGLPLIIVPKFASTPVQLDNPNSETIDFEESSAFDFSDQINRITRLFLAKPSVAGVIFPEFQDNVDIHPRFGLFDVDGNPKRYLQSLSKMRNRYIQ